MTPAPTLYQYVLRIAQREEQAIPQKIYELFQIFDRIYQDAVKTEQITFTTLFARVGYVGLKYHFTNDDLLIVHTFRKQASRYLDTSISAKTKRTRPANRSGCDVGFYSQNLYSNYTR